VDSELQQALAQFESRLNTRIDGVESRLNARIDHAVAQLEDRLNGRIDSVETRLRTYIEERIETTETKLLSAFHNWAQTFEVRARGTSAAVREFDERLGLIEERVAKIERSKN
jgi:predicted component of type VI protein secretion system